MQNYKIRSSPWMETHIVTYWDLDDDNNDWCCSDCIWYVPNDIPKPTTRYAVGYYYEDASFIATAREIPLINILDGLIEGMGCSDCFWYPIGWSE